MTVPQLLAALVSNDVVREFVFWSLAICIVYLAFIYAIDFLLVVFALFENAIRTRERGTEDFGVLEHSRIGIPVSVVVPVHNEEALIVPVVRSLLSMRYPLFEVILVNDGSTDGTLEILIDAFELDAHEIVVRQSLRSEGAVAQTYRSRRDERLIVVDKDVSSGKAAALNTGLNFCRFRYVCCVDGDTIYFDDALLKGMRVVLRDPARIIGVTSQVAVAERPEERIVPERHERLDVGLLSRFQHLDYLRAFLNDRLAWSRLGFMLCASGAFMIWRRDVLMKLGGFSSAFSCEDIEFTFRVHEDYLRRGEPYAVIALPEVVARTEGPRRLRSLVAQRERWHRVVLETVWAYRRMFLRPRYGAVGLIGMPFYVVSEVLAPLFEVLALLSLVAAVAVGLFEPFDYVLFMGLISFVLAFFTSAAVLLEDRASRNYRLHDLVRLMVLGPAELILYRPILVWARLRAVKSFVSGSKDWGKFERNPRLAADDL